MANERLTWEEAVQWLRDRPDKQDLASLPKVKLPRSPLLIPSN